MLPVVVKIGHSRGGVGKIRAESLSDINEAAHLAASASTYCTLEPFIDSKCDLRLQKIGNNYKAFLRKSLSGNWKANVGSSMLEQVAMSEQQRRWLDELSNQCGGLDIVALELVHAKDNHLYIIDAVDSSMSLLGDSQEDDRRLIADLVMQRMQSVFSATVIRNSLNSQMHSSLATSSNGVQNTSIIFSDVIGSSSSQRMASPLSDKALSKPPVAASPTQALFASAVGVRRILPQEPLSAAVANANGSPSRVQLSPASLPSRVQIPASSPLSLSRQNFQATRSSLTYSSSPIREREIKLSTGSLTSATSTDSGNATGYLHSRTLPLARSSTVQVTSTPRSLQQFEATEDTMQNLRTTFAGIFGEMPQ